MLIGYLAQNSQRPGKGEEFQICFKIGDQSDA